MNFFVFRVFLLIAALTTVINSRTVPIVLKNGIIAEFSNNQGLLWRSLNNSLKPVPPKQRTLFLKDYLDSLGFFSQKWDSSSVDSIRIDPGVRSTIVSENISCNQCSLLTDIKLHDLPILYDAGVIRAGVSKISQVLVEKGYPFAQVIVEILKDTLQENSDKQELSVIYKVKPDQLYRFSSPIFSGGISTRKKIILNDVALKPGEPYSLSKIKLSESRLKSRVYISSANAGAPEIDTTDGKEGLVGVPFFIEDRKGLGLEGAIGFNSSADGKPAVFGNLTFSLINMLHLGESVSLEYAGDQKYQRLKIEMAKPWVFNLPLEISGNGTLEIVSGQYGFIAGNLKGLAETNSLWKIGAAFTIHEVTPSSDSLTEYSSAEDGSFYGAEFILQRITSEYSKGILAHQLQILTGSGIARKSKNYSRTHFEFSGSVHIPFLRNQAVMARAVSMHLMTKEEVLLPAELYRVGGYNSVRGYADEEFPFRTAFYGQFEYRYYFKNAGAVYIFADGGTGFEKKIALNSSHQQLFGYGVGLYIPSKIGGLVLEWARNLQDGKELGRLHIRVQNSFISRNHSF